MKPKLRSKNAAQVAKEARQKIRRGEHAALLAQLDEMVPQGPGAVPSTALFRSVGNSENPGDQLCVFRAEKLGSRHRITSLRSGRTIEELFKAVPIQLALVQRPGGRARVRVGGILSTPYDTENARARQVIGKIGKLSTHQQPAHRTALEHQKGLILASCPARWEGNDCPSNAGRLGRELILNRILGTDLWVSLYQGPP